MRTNVVLSVLFACVLAYVATPIQAQTCDPDYQIAPNPNPVGNMITVSETGQSYDGCNYVVFDNFGSLVTEESTWFRNEGTINNDGLVLNQGLWLSQNGAINNNGLIVNEGLFSYIGTLNNNGHILNEGTIQLPVGVNSGLITNNGRFELSGSGSGTLTNDGRIVNSGTMVANNSIHNLANNGQIDNYGLLGGLTLHLYNNAGATLNNYGSMNGEYMRTNNEGTINNHGLVSTGTFISVLNNLDGAVYNNYGRFSGAIDNRSGATLFTSGHVNLNSVRVPGDRPSNNDGNIINSGEVHIDTLTGNGTYSQSDGSTTLTYRLGGITQSAVNIFGGELRGNGSITAEVTIDGGTMAVGMSPGQMNIFGDYTQTKAGTFAAEIGGLIQGVEYDFLSVSGTAKLHGLLDVSLYDFGGGSFFPALGDTFDILSAEKIVGRFTDFAFATLDTGLYWDVSYLKDIYGTTDVVRLHVAAVPEPEIYAMMAVGMGIMGWVARRKKRQQTTA